MRVLVDNNIIIDALNPNLSFAENAQEILRLSSEKAIDGFVSANSLTDIFYVLRKEHGAEKAKNMLKKLILILDIIGIEPADCINALSLAMNDFEDALVLVCAEKIKADFIVTRDEKFIREETAVPTVTPSQFIEKHK